jgi:PAS domain S-box-containing protein
MQPKEQPYLDFGETCACVVLDKKGLILHYNKMARDLFKLEKKHVQKTNFFKRFLDKTAPKLSAMPKAWAGDIFYKNAEQYFFSQWLPNQDTNILNIFPYLSQSQSERSPKLEKVLQNTSDGILLLDTQDGQIIEANETACKLLAYENRELIGKKFSDIETELQAQKEETSWTKFLIELKQKSPEPLQVLTQFVQKDSTTIPVASSVCYEENKGDSYISVTFRDVSSQDRFEEFLDNRNKKFQILIENLEDSILLIDEAANILYTSPAAQKSWGYKADELQGENLFDLVHPYDASLAKKIFFEVINTRKKLFRTTFRIVFKDGSEHWMEIKAKNLLREPAINAILLIIQNVTQQTLAEEKLIQALENEKKLNEELAKREEKLKNTLDLVQLKEIELKKANQVLEDAQTYAQMGSWYIDVATEKITWSKQTFLSFGMNPQKDAPPKNRYDLKRLIHEQDLPKLSKCYDDILSGKADNYEIELRQYQKNTDTYRWFLTKAQAIRENNELVGISGITLDIHERKLAEEKLRKTNEELSKANSELDRFVYSVSHDLRAPISSLLGLIQLSRMTNNIEEIREYMALQEKSIKRLDNFIKDILDYSRNARLEFTPERIHFREIIDSCFEQHSHMKNALNITKTIQIEENAPFYSDKGRLSIVLNNLLSNSIKYANPRQGSPFIKIMVNVQPKEVFVEIEDNGIGIGKDHLGKIFNMFYRANDTLAGSGLGLYIVRETITKLGGNIGLESELGKGTKIYFNIPNNFMQNAKHNTSQETPTSS